MMGSRVVTFENLQARIDDLVATQAPDSDWANAYWEAACLYAAHAMLLDTEVKNLRSIDFDVPCEGGPRRASMTVSYEDGMTAREIILGLREQIARLEANR
jgi:hypothetical protein